MREKASAYDSMAALNRRYNPEQSDLLKAQAKSLETIWELIEDLKRCSRIKEKLGASEKHYEEMEQLFK